MGEHLVFTPNGLVRFVHDAKVKRPVRFPRSLSQNTAALVGGEDNARRRGSFLQEGGDLTNLGRAWNTKIIGVCRELIAIHVPRPGITAYANPFGFDVVGKVFAGPDVEGLLDQRKTGDGDNDTVSQAKVLSEQEVKRVLAVVSAMKHARRNRLLVLLSFQAGMRAGEIAALKISNVQNEDGSTRDRIHLDNNQTKGDRHR